MAANPFEPAAGKTFPMPTGRQGFGKTVTLAELARVAKGTRPGRGHGRGRRGLVRRLADASQAQGARRSQ